MIQINNNLNQASNRHGGPQVIFPPEHEKCDFVPLNICHDQLSNASKSSILSVKPT